MNEPDPVRAGNEKINVAFAGRVYLRGHGTVSNNRNRIAHQGFLIFPLFCMRIRAIHRRNSAYNKRKNLLSGIPHFIYFLQSGIVHGNTR
jgi:hypothetical protein